jgi:hypothetical protein
MICRNPSDIVTFFLLSCQHILTFMLAYSIFKFKCVKPKVKLNKLIIHLLYFKMLKNCFYYILSTMHNTHNTIVMANFRSRLQSEN